MSNSKKILVVDDTPLTLMMLCDVLEEGGHEVVGQAENGDEALTLFDEKSPELTIVDLIMPGKDGAAVVKEIRSRRPDARVVVTTAVAAENEHLARALDNGACAWLPKPFAPDEVLRLVDEV